jgi:hypothetical protein
MTAIRASFTAPSDNQRTTVSGPVLKLVAFPAKRDQVGLGIITKAAAPSQVVNIEILGAFTFLTAPTITLQDFSTQPDIYPRRLSNSRSFLRSELFMVPALCRSRLLRSCGGIQQVPPKRGKTTSRSGSTCSPFSTIRHTSRDNPARSGPSANFISLNTSYIYQFVSQNQILSASQRSLYHY